MVLTHYTLALLATLVSSTYALTAPGGQGGPNNPFIGCYNENAGFTFTNNFNYEQVGTATSGSQCATSVANIGGRGSNANYEASYWDPSTGKCYGGATPVSTTDFTFGNGNPGTCITGQVDVRLLFEYQQFYGCVQSSSQYSFTVTSSTQQYGDIASCLVSGGPDVIAWDQSTTTCIFGTVQGVYNTVQCVPGVSTNYFVYSQAPPTSGSGTVQQRRRDGRAKAFRDQQHLGDLCPMGHLPCLVESGSSSFECVEVDNELESCGGCMHGIFGEGDNTKAGKDCSIGAVLGSAMCVHGQCRNTQCVSGFTLSKGACVAK